jgi:hypothetical protein
MTAASTPGPWRVSDSHQGQIVTDRTIIADTVAPYPMRRDEQAANARLIAAAPDMRYLLARTLDWIDIDETTGDGPLVLVREIRALLARLDDVEVVR